MSVIELKRPNCSKPANGQCCHLAGEKAATARSCERKMSWLPGSSAFFVDCAASPGSAKIGPRQSDHHGDRRCDDGLKGAAQRPVEHGGACTAHLDAGGFALCVRTGDAICAFFAACRICNPQLLIWDIERQFNAVYLPLFQQRTCRQYTWSSLVPARIQRR